MVFHLLKRGFVRAKTAMRNTLVGDWASRVWGQGPATWYFLTFNQQVRTNVFEKGNVRLIGKAMQYGEGGERYPRWGVAMSKPEVEKLLGKIEDSGAAGKLRAFVEGYNALKSAQDTHDSAYGGHTGVTPGTNQYADTENQEKIAGEGRLLVKLPGTIKDFQGFPSAKSVFAKHGWEDKHLEFEFKGKKYWVSVGDFGQVDVFRQPNGKEPFWKSGFWKRMWNWRENWQADTHILPPEDQKNFWFTRGVNKQHSGESHEAWVARVTANYQKLMGDATGMAWVQKIIAESVGKRIWHHMVGYSKNNSVSGRLLGQALQWYSASGYETTHTPGAYDPNCAYEFSELDPNSQMAILGYLIDNGIDAGQAQVAHMDPYRRKELVEKYHITAEDLAEKNVDKDVMEEAKKLKPPQGKLDEEAQAIKDLAIKSLVDDQDWVLQADKATTRPERAAEGMTPAPKLVVTKEGVIDVASVVQDASGKQSPHVPRGAQPFFIPRWNIPTIVPMAWRMIPYAVRSKQFLEPLVKLGMAMDTNAFQLHSIQRQPMKTQLMSMFHNEGIADSPWRLAYNVAATLGWDPARAERMAISIHEITPKLSGAYWDHLGIRTRSMQQALEQSVRLEYFSPERFNRDPGAAVKAAKNRGNFLEMVFADPEVEVLVRSYDEAKDSKNYPQASDARTQLAKYIARQYNNEMFPAPWKGYEDAPRRYNDIANFIIRYSDLMRYLVGGDNKSLLMAMKEEKQFYDQYSKQHTWEPVAWGKAA